MSTSPLQIEVIYTSESKLSGECRGNDPITVNYAHPQIDGTGYSPVELLLVSLASCSGATVVSILQKKRRTINGFNVKASGIRREENPTIFEQINLDFTLRSPDAAEVDLVRAIELSEEKYCPVWAMLKGNVDIKTNYHLIS